jgi:ABC-type phosphate/phosphonate transport system permease subunit
MNSILYTAPAFSGWMLLVAAALMGFILGAIIWIPLGMLIKKNREPEAWNRVTRMQRKFDELSAKYNKAQGLINGMSMVLEEWQP